MIKPFQVTAALSCSWLGISPSLQWQRLMSTAVFRVIHQIDGKVNKNAFHIYFMNQVLVYLQFQKQSWNICFINLHYLGESDVFMLSKIRDYLKTSNGNFDYPISSIKNVLIAILIAGNKAPRSSDSPALPFGIIKHILFSFNFCYLFTLDDLCCQRCPSVHCSLPPSPRPLLWSQSRLLQRELLLWVGRPLPGSGGRALQGQRRRRWQGGWWREKAEDAETAHNWKPWVWRPASPRPSKD